jgi:hypothetical protein
MQIMSSTIEQKPLNCGTENSLIRFLNRLKQLRASKLEHRTLNTKTMAAVNPNEPSQPSQAQAWQTSGNPASKAPAEQQAANAQAKDDSEPVYVSLRIR